MKTRTIESNQYPGRTMLLELARAGVSLTGGAPDEGGGSGDQGAAGQGGAGAAGGQSDAERRAAAAEAENRRLKDEQARRDAADKRRQKEKDDDAARSARTEADDAKARAEKLEAENKAFRERFKAQTDSKLEALPEETRKRVEKFRAKLDPSDFDELVSDELARSAGGATPPTEPGKNPPPPGYGNVTRVAPKPGEGRTLDPYTTEILDEMGVSQMAARRMLSVEKNGDKAKFVLPSKELTRFMRERSLRPGLLSERALEELMPK